MSRPIVHRIALLAVAVVCALSAFGGETAAARPEAPVASADAAAGPEQCGASGGASSAQIKIPPATDIAKLVADKAGAFLKEKGIQMGYKFALQLTGLDKIIPKSADDQILDGIRVIQAQLADIQARIDAVADLVNQAIQEQRDTAFNDTLAYLCGVYSKVWNFYKLDYKPLINADVALGELLRRSADTSLTEDERAAATAGIKDAQADLDDAITEFQKGYNPSVYDSYSLDISQRLVPSGISLLTRYGNLAMTKRFLTRADSVSLRGLYDEFAQVEGLATLMTAEYYSKEKKFNPLKPGDDRVSGILKDYLDQSDLEHSRLPKVIPAGAVVDLGAVNQVSTDRKPMWYPATPVDQSWYPDNSVYGIPARNDAVNVLNALNKRAATDQVADNNWGIPTAQELIALMSSQCLANQANPSQYVDPKLACKNAIKTNALDYMLALNKPDPTWQSLFCHNTATVKCAVGGAGIGATKPPHGWIWVTGTGTYEMKCGHTIIPLGTNARTYTFHLAFQTGATTAVPGAVVKIPYMPSEVPGYGVQNADIGHKICDQYMNGLIWGQPPAPGGQAVLMLTRFTGAADLNEAGIDYMAKTPPKAASSVALDSVDGADKLHVDIDTNLGRDFWTFHVQRRVGNDWRTVGTYRSQGNGETRTLDLPPGKYRVVVPRKYRYKGSKSRSVKLRQ
ncbi:MAG TPA: hypothetical protein VH247_02995 [Thermoleophilaceae bacterium]|jgi:hypothetical protein|nr:hypothetical protein [Thermoleophilaceae bacterium]